MVIEKMKSKENNYAFIDGQNLYMSTLSAHTPWRIDLERFRVYLKQKYNVEKAYYFLGFVQEKNQELYNEIQEAGFILQFREHNPAMLGKKKGNVDTDIVFHIMKKLYRREQFGNIVLVSGDGDYKLLVDFLIEEERFEKILFPDGVRASSLYKKITRKYFDNLDKEDVRAKIGKRKGGLR
ncbi:MAG: NYN domain-containing protein [Minisyncoccota bacterium]